MPVSVSWTRAQGRRYLSLYRLSQDICVVFAIFARLVMPVYNDGAVFFFMGAKLGSRLEGVEDQ